MKCGKFVLGCMAATVLVIQSTNFAASSVTVSSPNRTVTAQFQVRNGVPHWSLSFHGAECLQSGRLGVEIAKLPMKSLASISADVELFRETVKTTWGKFSEYDNHYKKLVWTLRETSKPNRTLRIVSRVYDQGIALRYEFPKDGGWSDEIRLTNASTEFRFADDHTGWAYNREHDPVGPQPLMAFRKGKNPGANLPFTVQCDDDAYLGILEAAIFDQAPYRLVPLKGAPTGFQESFSESPLPAGGTTSWRVVLLGKTAGDLLTTPLLYCLNPKCAIEDTSWIKPGLAFWDWRAWGAKTDDGFKYGLDMASWRRFIDFGSKHNIRYLVLDANWYGPEFDKTSDPRTSRDHLVTQTDMQRPQIVRTPAPENWDDPIDVPGLIKYAKERNVGIILYFNDIARNNYPFEEVLALYHKWGAAGIKYGFMKAKGQQKVHDTREIIRLCAKYQLLCNFHDGPVPPSGDQRTYPNYVTREFCHSQSDALRAFSPTGFCEQVFVNMLAGPLDMCNGLYTLKNPAKLRPRIFVNVDATVVAETARVLITFSGLSILPDCPEAYAAKADLFDFITRLPMTWDETRILHSSIGNFISTARRNGDCWFVGSATNEESRTLEVNLDFLKSGAAYTATIYEDAPDAHFKTNREAYRVLKREVKQGDIILASMVPGGGHCILLEPK
jgi:hypothetical protein